MTSATRLVLILTLLIAATIALSGQEAVTSADSRSKAPSASGTAAGTTSADAAKDAEEPAPEAEEAETASEAPTAPSAYEVRNELTGLIQRYPSDFTELLVLEPTLLTNEAFLSGYPEVATYVSRHPEIARNPRFYVAQFGDPRPRRGVLDELMQGLEVFVTFSLVAFVLSWLVRTVIEQKRWNRLSRTQSEVHNKILDRFGTTSELLDYIRTPAGMKFLESAPIPLHEERPVRSTPMSRILLSIQLGVIVAAGALGMLLVSGRFEDPGFFAIGVIALCLGVGFIASAAISLSVSRRLGLWQAPEPSDPLDDRGLVR